MGSILREYETLYVLNAELADDVADGVISRLTELLVGKGAVMLREDRWGKRKLSFEVKKQFRGNYILFHYLAAPGVVEELERTLRNLDEVIRFLSTSHGNVFDVEAKKAEVEKMVRDRAAEKARIEAERREREERMASEASRAGESDDVSAEGEAADSPQ